MQLPSLQNPSVLPFVISTIMQRMTSPWQIIRLAISFAASDEETRVAATPYGLPSAWRSMTSLCWLMTCVPRSSAASSTAAPISSSRCTMACAICGLSSVFARTRNGAASCRRSGPDISNALTSELESVPGRVRRLLRHRSDKDIGAGARIDVGEADETVALVNFVITCRNYASELAISEVTLRSFSELQHYLESPPPKRWSNCYATPMARCALSGMPRSSSQSASARRSLGTTTRP